MKNLIYKYVVYVIYFLGIGMTSSGIVLMPFNTVRYSIILLTGLSLFLAGSVFNEVVINSHKMSLKESIRLVLLSLTLALGIGMISGGISHYKESPQYVSFLIPAGLIISFISFAFKNNIKLNKKERFITYIGLAVFAFIIFIALYISATSVGMSMDMPAGGDIFNGGH